MEDFKLSGILEKKENGRITQSVVFFSPKELSHCLEEKDGRPFFMLKTGVKLYDYTSMEERGLLLKELGNFVKFGNSAIVDMDYVEGFDPEESFVYFKNGGFTYIAKFLLKNNKRLRELLKNFIKKRM